tara:strand:+ start:320 stop:640 length:321 start_codon:yes stop_codon:yes gene_type:complete
MNEMMKVNKAILNLNSSAVFSIIGGDNPILDACEIIWLEGTTPISKEDIKTKMDELQSEYDAQDYARKREGEYPKIGDQLDKIYHEGIDAWKADMITPIKNKYPKG